ncbi:amino acid adenylation domain-containing protein [Micromonospora sp. NPDC048170]|uniref:amino acid adenylation domain-containing protein n=1 Tax=Micromonospora sp. NPDC048170 TaxID=3154819 RepID=UPI0033CE0041
MSVLLHELLTRAAATHPDHPALIDGDRTFTYRELDEWSNHLARQLRQGGVRAGDRVGVHLDKSAEAVAGIYGALKAGAAYVPLDPDAPARRLRVIAADSAMSALLTGGRQASAREPFHTGLPDLRFVINLDGTAERAGTSAAPPEADARGDRDRLAYLLYTSGSTGTPKGVALSHGNGLAFVEWAVREFGLAPTDRVSSHAPLHFDLSVFDLFATAAGAATLVLVPKRASVFLPELVEFIQRRRLTVWYSVPSVLTMMVRRGQLTAGCFPDLRLVLFAGEVMPPATLRRLMWVAPGARFVNLYGPTETNVCTWHEVRQAPQDDEPIPIGRAVDGVETFVVSDDGGLVDVGQAGELLVAGPTVMRGYWNDPESTASALVTSPAPGAWPTAYRTGDLVRLGTGGEHHFIGRRDHQVKSRGHRIELGEIEAVIRSHPAVAECAVVPVADEEVTNRLWACVVPDGELEPATIAALCRERLPRYMVPDRLELFDELPRTSTGKTDRQALHASLLRVPA